MQQSFVRKAGQAEWTHLPGDKYLVTGVTRHGSRVHLTFDSWFWARGINVWHGSRWLVRDGKRKLIQRIIN